MKYLIIFSILVLANLKTGYAADLFVDPSLDGEEVKKSLETEWQQFDKSTGVVNEFVGSIYYPQWVAKITPPFPNSWPPTTTPTFTYYAYAAYKTFLRHGVQTSISAPWAAVAVARQRPLRKTELGTAIGPVTTVQSGWRWSNEEAYLKSHNLTNTPAFLNWTNLDNDSSSESRAIALYYCQWAVDYREFAKLYITATSDFLNG